MLEKINILGTDYKIEKHKVSEDSLLEKNNWVGYCGEYDKLIVVADTKEKDIFKFETAKERHEYDKEILRHEIVHAFLNESGLSNNTYRAREGWAKNEEMVDWIAIQFPKILKVCKELRII